jgi:hypothetical protein
VGRETGTAATAPDIGCSPHSWSLRCDVCRYDVDTQDSGSDDGVTPTAVTQRVGAYYPYCRTCHGSFLETHSTGSARQENETGCQYPVGRAVIKI